MERQIPKMLDDRMLPGLNRLAWDEFDLDQISRGLGRVANGYSQWEVVNGKGHHILYLHCKYQNREEGYDIGNGHSRWYAVRMVDWWNDARIPGHELKFSEQPKVRLAKSARNYQKFLEKMGAKSV